MGGGVLNASFNIRESITPLFNLQYIMFELVYPILGIIGSSLDACKSRGGGGGLDPYLSNLPCVLLNLIQSNQI